VCVCVCVCALDPQKEYFSWGSRSEFKTSDHCYKPRPQGICTKIFVKISQAVPGICSWTDRHTDRQTNWSQAPLPYQDGITTRMLSYFGYQTSSIV